MVLIFTEEKRKRKDESDNTAANSNSNGVSNSAVAKGGDAKYKLSVFSTTALVVSLAGDENRPRDEDIKNALLSFETPIKPTFFVMPYDGLIEDPDAPGKNPTMTWLLSDISQCVSRRENVTVINRGVNSDMRLEQVMIDVLGAIRSSAEYAMQVVADEIAKEKQMQRLLQLESENNTEGVKEILKRTAENANRDKFKRKSIPLSRRLKKQLKELNGTYPYATGGRATAATAADTHHTSGTRYTILSATHGDDIEPPCQKGSHLVPTSFSVNPPSRRPAETAQRSQERSIRNNSYLFNAQKRKSTLAVLAQLNDDSASKVVENPKGNGWGEKTYLFAFDGEASVMALPGVPHFEDVVKSFAVDFWIRTDCTAAEGMPRVILQIMEGQRDDVGQLFQLSLNWYPEMEDSFRIFARDASNRVLEALVSLRGTELTKGKEFHHVMLHVISMEEGKIDLQVNGKSLEVQLMQDEHPIAFNAWPHRLFVGGYLDDANAATMVFRGSLLELRFWAGLDKLAPIVRWPLLVSDGTLEEMTRTIPPDHHETLQSLRRIEETAPPSAPLFDGGLVANLGNISLWGELMHNWRFEIRFRTDVTSRMMSLIGVTDQKIKMQQFGIVLNAEPVVSKERFRYFELNTTFFVVDAFGVCCSALLRGNERQNLMDGEWHTVVWRCIDSETNKFSVKVDGVIQDLLYISREGPNRFLEFEDWVCLGGHNVRNWKVERPFVGQISRCYVTIRGYRFVTLEMNEGPGAYVLLDRSGHDNHGLLIDKDTNVVRKNDIIWMPAKSEYSNEEEGRPRADIVVYENNNVSIAAVVFTCDFNSRGIPSEAIYDVFTEHVHQPQIVPDTIHNPDTKNWQSWMIIPAECFKPLDSITQLEKAIDDVLAAQVPRGHLMVVVKIGDSHVTILHIHEPQLPSDATYDCNMLKWHYPYMVEGKEGRTELMLNRMVEAMEKILISDTLTPYTTARLGPLNSSSGSMRSEDIVRNLINNGKPWYLAAVLHNHLLNSLYGSSLHIIHHIVPRMTFDEAASVCLFNKKLHDGAREKASLVIQRNWRGRLAKAEAEKRQQVRQMQDRKLEEIRSFRMNPVVQPKKSLYALLITMHTSGNPKKVKNIESNLLQLEDILTKQGYYVERLENPDARTVMKAIAQIDADKSSFIFLSGYGGQMNLRQPFNYGLQMLHLALQEDAARAGIELEQGREFRRCAAVFMEEKAGIKPKKKGSKKKNAAPPPKKLSAEEQQQEAKRHEQAWKATVSGLEFEETTARESQFKDYEIEVQQLSREFRAAIAATKDFEKKYKSPGPDGAPRSFLSPVNSTIEPFANNVIDVEEIFEVALHRRVPPVGLQSIVAIDLYPMTPFCCGGAFIASSTGNTLRIPYKPLQQALLTWNLNKAFDGHLPRVPANSKYAVLSGGIETPSNQRDWKSFATYLVTKLESCCKSPEVYRGLRAELEREVPFTAELIPVRDIAMNDDAKDRLRRDREAQKVDVGLLFGIGSPNVQSDMFSIFKVILDGMPLTEITFKNSVNVLMGRNNKDLDGILLPSLTDAIEKCRPNACTIQYTIEITQQGVMIAFDNTDRLGLTHWLNSITLRSLTWEIGMSPLFGYRRLQVEYVEYLYYVKTKCNVRTFRKMKKESLANPVPEQYIRYISCDILKSG